MRMCIPERALRPIILLVPFSKLSDGSTSIFVSTNQARAAASASGDKTTGQECELVLEWRRRVGGLSPGEGGCAGSQRKSMPQRRDRRDRRLRPALARAEHWHLSIARVTEDTTNTLASVSSFSGCLGLFILRLGHSPPPPLPSPFTVFRRSPLSHSVEPG